MTMGFTLRTEDFREKHSPPDKVGQEHLCQQSGQLNKENFKLSMLDTSEEGVDMVRKQFSE